MVPVAIALTRVFPLRLAPDDALAILADVPAWSVLFPHVERVEPLGGVPDAFLWTMEPMGPPGADVQIVYACQYATDAVARRVSWTPVDGIGNARFEGSVSVAAAQGGGSQGALSLGAVFEVPAPAFVGGVVRAAVNAEFKRMVGTFAGRLGAL